MATLQSLDVRGLVAQFMRPLLLTVARHLQSHRSKEIQLLSYGDDEQTIAIYQDVGFHLDAHYVTYQGFYIDLAN